jgi:phosphotriesterase-related protein
MSGPGGKEIIRTVLGDLKPEQLGLTLAHEHLLGQPPQKSDPDLILGSEAAAINELRLFKQAGGGAVVEMTTIDYGRDAVGLAHIAQGSGVHVIAATGFNKGKFADRITEGKSAAQLADCMTKEVLTGIGDTAIRAGVIKASSSLDGANTHELKVFEAAAQTHLATHAPISTHTEKGTWALGQIKCLGQYGVKLGSVLIGHLDLKPDLPYLLEVASTGVFMGLDQFSKAKYLPDAKRVEMVVKLGEAGYLNRLLLSGDLARRSYWHGGGGPGFDHIPKTVAPMLLEAGLLQSQVETLLMDNPRRWLTFGG